MLKRIFNIKVLLFFLAVLFIGIGFLVFALNQEDYSYDLSLAQKYAPNFWFDSEEQYYPCDYSEFYYDKNMNEIPGEEAKADYNKLTKEEKLSHFKVFYKVKDEPKEKVIEYWLFYVYDEFINQHYGDAESVFVFLNKDTGKIDKIVASEHWGDKFKVFLANAELDNPKVNHINILVEEGSHANWIDGNGNGIVDRKGDTTNWYESYGSFLFSDWSIEDKINGVRMSFDDPRYRLIPFSNLQENIKGKEKLKRSPDKGIPFLGHYIPLGGKPADLAAIGDKPENPDKVKPVTGEWVMNKMSDFSAKAQKDIASFVETVSSAFHSVISPFAFQANVGQGIPLVGSHRQNAQPPEENPEIVNKNISQKPSEIEIPQPQPQPQPQPAGTQEIGKQLEPISQSAHNIQEEAGDLVSQIVSPESGTEGGEESGTESGTGGGEGGTDTSAGKEPASSLPSPGANFSGLFVNPGNSIPPSSSPSPGSSLSPEPEPEPGPEIIIENAESVLDLSLNVSSDVADAKDAPSQNIFEAFVSHSESTWRPDSLVISSDITNAKDAPSQDIQMAFVSHGESVWYPDSFAISSDISDIMDSTDVPSQNISQIYLSNSESSWYSNLEKQF